MFKNKYLKIFLIFFIASLIVIFISNYKKTQPIFITKLISSLTSPIQKVCYISSEKISSSFKNTFYGKKLKEENNNLQKEINDLRKKLVEFNKYKIINKELNKLLEIKKENPSFDFEPALVISKISNDPFKSFYIDKGSKNGIKFQDSVISPEGLVGYVYKVNEKSSLVKTILDANIDVGVYNSNTGESGILTGNMSLSIKGLCKVKYLSKQSQTKPKDIFITSGIGNLFPKGILIGEAVKLKSESHGASYYCVLSPFCNINELKAVFIIKNFSNEYVESNKNTIGASSEIRLGTSSNGDN